MKLSMALGDVLSSEKPCGLSYKQEAISKFIDSKVPATDMDFTSDLSMHPQGRAVLLMDMSESSKTAHLSANRTGREVLRLYLDQSATALLRVTQPATYCLRNVSLTVHRKSSFRLLQPQLHQPPYRFRPCRRVVLLVSPSIYRSQIVRLKTHADERAYPGGRRSALFLCYHGLTFHGIYVNTVAGRKEVGASLPALTPARKVLLRHGYPNQYHTNHRRPWPVIC